MPVANMKNVANGNMVAARRSSQRIELAVADGQHAHRTRARTRGLSSAVSGGETGAGAMAVKRQAATRP